MPPRPPRTAVFWLTPLHPDLAQQDYAAFRSCRVRLDRELEWGGWPGADFSLADNVADLARHYAEFERNEAYAYSVMADTDRCIGCVYIEPWKTGAQLAFWVVDGALDQEATVVSTVLSWLRTWPFDAVVVPVRDHNTRRIAVLQGLNLTRCDGPDGHLSFV